MEKIKTVSVNCHSYLESLGPARWATHAFLRPRYGHLTSNISEAVNHQWEEAREKTALGLLAHVWHQQMQRCFERRHRKQKTTRITNFAMTYLAEQAKESRRYSCQGSDREKAMVVTPTGGHHIVCLAEKVCSCGDFQEHLLPCRHALTVCKEHGPDPEDYVSPIYCMESYRATSTI